MNLLPWMMLVFLLSAGTSLAHVDVNWLAEIVRAITLVVRRDYNIGGEYCLAANIPLNQDPNTLGNILQEERNVGNTVQSLNQVYIGHRIVIATPEGGEEEEVKEHAEPRVLKELNRLRGNSAGNFLLIYSFLSPCRNKCTNPNNDDNILTSFHDLPAWGTNYAFVFTKVYNQPQGRRRLTTDQLIRALRNLGNTELGLRNIYRCFKPNDSFQCYSCKSQLSVSDVCVDNVHVPGLGGSSSYNIGQGGGGSSNIINRKTPRIRSQSQSSSGSSSSGYNISKKKPRIRSQSQSSSSSGSSSSSYNISKKKPRIRSQSQSSSRG